MNEIVDFLRWIKKFEELFRVKPQKYFSMENAAFVSEHPQLFNELKHYYFRFFGKKFNPSCDGCFLNPFYKLRNLTIKNLVDMENVKSKLVAGRVLKLASGYYSNESPKLTNEICRELFETYGETVFEYYVPAVDEITVEEVKKEFNIATLKKQFEVVPDALIINDTMKVKELLEVAKDKGIKIKSRKRLDIYEELKSQL